MGLLNINSVCKHIDQLRVVMASEPLDILAINCETKLDKCDSDQLISLTSYNIVRRNRNRHRNRRGGGVCIYLRNSITFERRCELEENDLKLIPLEISKPDSRPFLVVTWYMPPKTPLEHFEKFEIFLEKADTKYTEIYILGDLNCNILSNTPESHTTHLLDSMVKYQLSHLIKELTRVNANTKTLIDVFITNKTESIIHSGVYPLSISDHNLIYAVRKISIPRAQPKFVESRNCKNFNELKFITDLKNAPWPHIDNSEDVNTGLGYMEKCVFKCN